MPVSPQTFVRGGAIAMTVILLASAHPSAGPRHDHDRDDRDANVKHVLLISIDGMHALDYANCASAGTCPHLAELGETGVTYTRTTTSRPSDSFPGLMALVTGGTPKSVGAFYDVAYDRVLAGPTIDTGNGLPGTGPAGCKVGSVAGYETEYEEGIELNQHNMNGGGPYSMFDGGVLSIDPLKLPRDPFNGCKPVYPWNFVRTNTIYGVIHAAGGYTAWSDKHPAYATVSGPTGTSVPSNVDDYYAPEVNSDIVSIPGFHTVAGDDCSNIAHAAGDDWTTDFASIRCYDQLKVNAVVNEIMGKDHLGARKAPVPTILGMNFQAVSVGQKLIKGVKGGYTDAAGDPTPSMLAEIKFADAAIGQMVDALRDRGLLRSTAIIITAKHGQSPIDTNRFFPIPGHSGTNGQPPSAVIGSFLPAVYSNPTERPRHRRGRHLAALVDESLRYDGCGQPSRDHRNRSGIRCDGHRTWAAVFWLFHYHDVQRSRCSQGPRPMLLNAQTGRPQSAHARYHRDPQRRSRLYGKPQKAI